MLTPTYVNVKSFFYPLGNTPAANLLRDYCPSEEAVQILAIGCGDVRNILFTLWSEQNSACAFDFTTCDLDPAVLEASLSQVRRIWTLYSETRTRQEDVAVRHDIKSMYDNYYSKKEGPKFAMHAVRSAGAHGLPTAQPLNEAFHDFWKTGVVAGNDRDVSILGQDDGGRVNPLMAISPIGPNGFNVHYGADSLAGFHLAEVFDVPQTKVTIKDSLASLVKFQFSDWCRSFASRVATSSVNIMHHCGDAVNFVASPFAKDSHDVATEMHNAFIKNGGFPERELRWKANSVAKAIFES
ncbi:hypothetical protein KCU91_g9350, partial [Aureobasidium melanogenum]